MTKRLDKFDVDYRERNTVAIFDVRTMRHVFDLVIYGVTYRELLAISEEFIGGQIIRQSLRRAGFNPDNYIATPFAITKGA